MRSTIARRSAPARRATTALALTAAAALLLSGCALFGSPKAHPTASHTRTATPTPKPTRTASGIDATSTPSPTPEILPTLTPVPAGTVVAEGSVASPKGSIHYRYRVVSNGDNTYSAQYSGFTSTVPVPVSATFLETPPQVGDGLTFHGDGDHQLGGPTTSPLSTSAIIPVGQPSYLAALVTYSSAPSSDGVPQELGPDKVLAVNTVTWSVPVRASNITPVDGGPLTGAAGSVTRKTAAGAPITYVVATGDLAASVAARFGITVTALYWLNPDLPAAERQQYLYEGTSLNLDPDRL